MKVSIDPTIIEKAAIAAFRDTCEIIGRTATQVISENGAFPGFPGDIVDTGALRASQRITYLSPTAARFSWSQEYALYVHEGYQKRNGQTVAGRPWTRETLARVNVPETFGQLVRAKL